VRTRLRPAVALMALVFAAAGPGAFGAARATLEDPVTGKAVVVEAGARALHLVFFATWCPTCVDELPRLGALEARWGGRGYRLVIVAVGSRQTAERLADFVAEEHPAGRFLFDARGEAEKAWKAKQLPTHVVLDASGREVVRAGTLDGEVEAALADLLADRRGGGRPR